MMQTTKMRKTTKTTTMTMTMTISHSYSPRPFLAPGSLPESGTYFHEARIGAKRTFCRRKTASTSPSKQVLECRDSRFSVSTLFYNHILKSGRRIYVRLFLLNIVSLYSCIILPKELGIPRYRTNSASAEVMNGPHIRYLQGNSNHSLLSSNTLFTD